ncbi:MAG: hypothetical protein ACR2RL_23055 [Gammaproteobacteria bacterium]
MKPFAVWLAAAIGAFAAFGGGYHMHLESSPRRVVVLVDTSYPMRTSWQAVAGQLANLEERRYTQFSLFTEKGKIHGWNARLRPGDVAPYAPRNLDKLSNPGHQPEFTEADDRILITNADAAELPGPSGWDILRLGR